MTTDYEKKYHNLLNRVLDLQLEFDSVHAAFVGAFDTPVARRLQADEYSEDARRRPRNFATSIGKL
ncbi:hypothetical protein, partial [Enterococcus faecium]|uniref:hypothetical protein n=1 Tax=Enterococcus faecium TaxID=1352 RepID=UPI0025B08AEC